MDFHTTHGKLYRAFSPKHQNPLRNRSCPNALHLTTATRLLNLNALEDIIITRFGLNRYSYLLPFTRGLLLALLSSWGSNTLHASTVVVPDSFNSVQLAIDSGADTILVRDGTYPERPHVDRPLVLRGIGSIGRPTLQGLQITNRNFSTSPPALGVSHIDFTGPVVTTTVALHPRNLQFDFSHCGLDSGFAQGFNPDPNDIELLRFLNCRLATSSARAYQVIMDADTVDGGVAWAVHDVWIQNSWFRGGTQTAIHLTDTPRPGVTAGNRIANYQVGIFVDNAQYYDIRDNLISTCGVGIVARGSSDIGIVANTIRDCGVGIDVAVTDGVRLSHNSISHVDGPGVTMSGAGSLDIQRNVILRCGAGGLVLDYLFDDNALHANTIACNGGPGIAISNITHDAVQLVGNIAFRNAGVGLSMPLAEHVTLRCNDWFGNTLGATSGIAPDTSDMSVDPMFCNVQNLDVSLDSTSPLLDRPGCGQIGALGVGCGVTAVAIQTITVEEVGLGVAVRWRFGAQIPDVVWLERGLAVDGPWERVGAEPTVDGGLLMQVDEHILAGVTYWYRIGWGFLDGRSPGRSAPISYTKEATVSRVFPNPSSGSLSVEWALESSAEMDVRVYDLAGREVAAIARSRFESGKHSAAWDGSRFGGGLAPAGFYLVRIRGGTIDSAHRFLLRR